LSNPPLVYIDASVFGYRLLPHDNNKLRSIQKSKGFFEDIEKTKYNGIISTVTELEYIGMVKRLISKQRKRQITDQEEQTALNDFELFTEQLGIGLTDSDDLAVDLFGISNIFSNSKTIIKRSHPYFHQQAGTWKNIGGTDALTISLAIRSNAQYFATFDRGFKGLNNLSITPLIIPDRY
jgi:predicted nucleic acid-binding protein